MGKFEWSVVSVVPHEDYTIDVEFHDGKRGRFDVSYLLQWPVFEPLKNKELFMAARASHGTVVWNEDIDIAPETLYRDCVPLGA